MPYYACDFCEEAGPERESHAEAEQAAKDAGFVIIMVPDPKRPLMKQGRFLCELCARHTRTHFLVEGLVTAASVLDSEDEAFENDTDW